MPSISILVIGVILFTVGTAVIISAYVCPVPIKHPKILYSSCIISMLAGIVVSLCGFAGLIAEAALRQ